jgi:hypothetical protein
MTKKSDKKENVVLKAIKPSGYPNELIFGTSTCGIEPLLSSMEKPYYTRVEVKKEDKKRRLI